MAMCDFYTVLLVIGFVLFETWRMVQMAYSSAIATIVVMVLASVLALAFALRGACLARFSEREHRAEAARLLRRATRRNINRVRHADGREQMPLDDAAQVGEALSGNVTR